MIGITNSKIDGNVIYNNPYIVNDYKLMIFDYDGTILDEENLTENTEYTLPNPPSHTGLVFQGWHCNQQITDNKIIIKDNFILISPIYTTASNENEFDIELNENTGLSVTLNMNGNKDWGDGITDSNTTHTYIDYGNYTIKCDGNTMTTDSSSGLFGQKSGDTNYYVTNVRIANVSNISSYAFQYCRLLENVILSNAVTNISDYAFRYCYYLKYVTLSNNITYIGSGSFYYCHLLHDIILSNSMEYICSETFYYCCNLGHSVIPSSIKTVHDNAFQFSASQYHDYRLLSNLVELITTPYQCYILKLFFPWDSFDIWSTRFEKYKNYIVYRYPAIVNFNITPNNYNIYIDNELVQNNVDIKLYKQTLSYVIYNPADTSNVYIGNISGLKENDNISIVKNLTNITYNKITLSIGVSDLYVIFHCGDNIINTIENNGEYYAYISGDIGTTLNYFIDGGNNYANQTDSVNLNGSDITINITLTPAVWLSWTRPNLTENGTLGVNSFAVSGNVTFSSHPAWHAMDDSSSTYWGAEWNAGSTREYSFYSATPLIVSELVIHYDGSRKASNVVISASNDNSNWQTITSAYSVTTRSPYIGTLTLTNSGIYTYYKLVFSGIDETFGINIKDIQITALYKEV